MIKMEVLYHDGSTLGLYEKIVVRWKIFNWDRYSWYQSQGFI